MVIMDLITFAIVVASMEFVVGLALLLSPERALDRVLEVLDNQALLSVIMFGFLILSVSVGLKLQTELTANCPQCCRRHGH